MNQFKISFLVFLLCAAFNISLMAQTEEEKRKPAKKKRIPVIWMILSLAIWLRISGFWITNQFGKPILFGIKESGGLLMLERK